MGNTLRLPVLFVRRQVRRQAICTAFRTATIIAAPLLVCDTGKETRRRALTARIRAAISRAHLLREADTISRRAIRSFALDSTEPAAGRRRACHRAHRVAPDRQTRATLLPGSSVRT